jgi:parvulin-like peptidyl-prolyl isomerase
VKAVLARLALPLILALAVVGCGSSSSGSSGAPTPAASPAATPHLLSTPVVTGGDTAAIVNGHKIPMSTFRMLLGLAVQQAGKQPGVTTSSLAGQTMTQLIDDEIVREYAAAHGLLVRNAEVTARVKSDEKQFGGAAGFEKQLAQVGLSFADYATLVRAAVQRHKVAHAVTPLQAAHVRHILIATTRHKPPRTDAAAHALAQQILVRIQHGSSFAALAKTYSDDSGSGKRGGDLGTFCTGVGVMVPSFDQASATLPPNHPGIVHSQFGYHILEVLSRGPARAGQCVSPSASPGTPPIADEQAPAFQTWVTTRARVARIQRIARVA